MLNKNRSRSLLPPSSLLSHVRSTSMKKREREKEKEGTERATNTGTPSAALLPVPLTRISRGSVCLLVATRVSLSCRSATVHARSLLCAPIHPHTYGSMRPCWWTRARERLSSSSSSSSPLLSPFGQRVR